MPSTITRGESSTASPPRSPSSSGAGSGAQDLPSSADEARPIDASARHGVAGEEHQLRRAAVMPAGLAGSAITVGKSTPSVAVGAVGLCIGVALRMHRLAAVADGEADAVAGVGARRSVHAAQDRSSSACR